MREKYVDIMRGLAMLAIMSVHLPREYTVIEYGLSFMVPAFFVVSGFFIKVRDDGTTIQIIREWYSITGKKLLLAYVGLSFWSIVVISLITLFQGSFSVMSIISLGYQFFSGLGILTLWFLPALIIGEIIVIIPWKSELRRFFIIGVLTIGCLLLSNKMTLHGVFGKACFSYKEPVKMISINTLIVLSQGILASFFINIGRYGRILLNKIKNLKTVLLLSLGCFFEIVQICISKSVIADIHYMNMTTPLRFMVAAIFGILAIAIFSIILERFQKGEILGYIGKNSLFMMGTHHNFMLTNAVGMLMSLFGLNKNRIPFLDFLIALGVLVFIELTLLRIFNKCNLMQYLFFNLRGKRHAKEN